ncbi:MAG: DUF2125 domain-containing protein [Alphaproteobacteria bacterium]|nr:DUF2125 domain-containing protein [Alphaproteobacteria bacterium]
MRSLLAIVLIAGGLWSGYWFIGSSAKQAVLESWFADRRADGWTAEYSSFKVVGFPNRFDSRFKDLNLKDPNSGIGWKAPLFNILALSYQPNHIIAAFAHSQVVSLPGEDMHIDSKKMMASVTFEPDTLLAVRRTELRSTDLTISSSKGWKTQADKLNLSTRRNADAELAQDVVFEAQNLTPTKEFRQSLDPKGQLPATIETLYLDMTLGFDAPWDRIAIEQGAPEVTKITLNKLDSAWGKLGLKGSGTLDVAKNGQLSGRLLLEVKNWRNVLDLLVTSGVLDTNLAATIKSGIELLTLTSSDPTSLKIPLVLKNGNMALGPIPLGYAPRFVRN